MGEDSLVWVFTVGSDTVITKASDGSLHMSWAAVLISFLLLYLIASAIGDRK